MYITRLELQNIGAFEHQVIEFNKAKHDGKADIHILTGVNGSGKSTILFALASLFFFEPVKKRYRFADDRSCIRIQPDNCQKPYLVRFDGNTDPDPSHLFYPVQSCKTYLTNDYDDARETAFEFAVFAYSGSRSLSSADIQSIQEIRTHPLRESLSFHNSVSSQVLAQWIANTKAKIAFALQDGKNDLAERYRSSLARIENTITEIAGYDVCFTFHYEPLSVGIKVCDEELEFDVLPEICHQLDR